MERAAATPRRRAPTKGDRRERALLDAIEVLLAEAPLARLSVDRIAARAGVSRTAFYFYFSSKEAALRALVERSLAPIWQTSGEWLFGDAEPRETLVRAVGGLVEAWTGHRELLTAVIDAASYDAEIADLWRDQLEGFIDAVEGRIRRDTEAGRARTVDPRLTAEALCWMNERYCYVYLGSGPRQRSPEQVREVLVHVWYETIYGD
jgi:TetR/AcrR family transcriptional regulator, ethionamide resistance regulator